MANDTSLQPQNYTIPELLFQLEMKTHITKESSCDGKIAYNTRAEASEAALSISQKNRTKTNVSDYKCLFCGKYHIGNNRGKKKMKEHDREKTAKPDKDNYHMPSHGRDKGFYLIKTNLHR